MRLIPARCAASDFSLSPPTGSTWPVRVTSPVIATSLETGRPATSDERCRHRDAGRRTVLGHGAGRDVDVEIVLCEPVVGQFRVEPALVPAHP